MTLERLFVFFANTTQFIQNILHILFLCGIVFTNPQIHKRRLNMEELLKWVLGLLTDEQKSQVIAFANDLLVKDNQGQSQTPSVCHPPTTGK